MLKRFREPFNSISHGIGAIAALIGSGVMLYFANTVLEYVGVSLFGTSLFFLYTSSAFYHGISASRKVITVLRRIDRVAIYGLIAGTVSPIALIAIQNWQGWAMLGLLWLFALLGIILVLMDSFDSSWIYTLIYLSMGWIPLAFIDQLLGSLSPGAFIWCIAGGVLYTVGALLYLADWPKLVPGHFGPHELWHVFCLLGSGSHYVLIAGYTL